MKNFVNRVAKKEYEITDTISCGVVLTGHDIKAIRSGRANLTGSYAVLLSANKETDPELWMIGAHIEGSIAVKYKLLVTKKQLEKLIGTVQQKHLALVLVRGYFSNSFFKVDVGIGKRLKNYQKRAKLREEDMNLQAARDLKR